MFAFGIRNPGLWNTEFRLRESGIPRTIGIYKESITITGNSENTPFCPESKTVYDYSVRVLFRQKIFTRNLQKKLNIIIIYKAGRFLFV